MSVHQFRVRRYQRPFHEELVSLRRKRLLEIAHRRWGKDEVVLHGFRELSQKRVGTYWHCFPEYAQARKAIWNGVNGRTGKRRLFEAFPPEVITRINDNDMFIELAWGSTWQLLGSDRYNATVGSGPVGIAYSEWALCDPAAWAYHRPMVEESEGVAAFITTPRGDNHAKKMLDYARAHPDIWYSEVSTVADTKALTAQQLVEALGEYQTLYGMEMGLALFEQEYHCSFSGAIIGAYWGGEMAAAERSGRMRFLPIDPNYPVHTAWDLGKAVNNPIWCFQVIQGRLRIVDFYIPTSDDLDDWCDWLNNQGYHGDDYVPDDVMDFIWGAKHTRWDLLKSKKRKPKLVKRIAVAEGIHAGREAIKLSDFHANADDPDDERAQRVAHGIDGLKNYRRQWDDARRTFLENPYKDWAEHIGSSWRYLGLAWREARSMTAPLTPPRDMTLVAGPNGTIQSNMTVKQAVDAMRRRREE